MHVRHAQFNRKSAIFGLQIGSFQGRSFPTAGQRNEDAGYEGETTTEFLVRACAVTFTLLPVVVPRSSSWLLKPGFHMSENPRLSGILLFPDRPRFCRLMKTRNRRYPRSSGMNGDKSGKSGAFLFSQRVPDFCDGRRSFPTNENSNLYRRGRRRWISLSTNPLNCWAPVPLSHINMASLENLGQTSGEYQIYR